MARILGARLIHQWDICMPTHCVGACSITPPSCISANAWVQNLIAIKKPGGLDYLLLTLPECLLPTCLRHGWDLRPLSSFVHQLRVRKTRFSFWTHSEFLDLTIISLIFFLVLAPVADLPDRSMHSNLHHRLRCCQLYMSFSGSLGHILATY